MERQTLGIKDELLRICWWMRGSINYQQALNLSFKEREIINKLIKENLEAGKKAGVPIF